jgi:glycosyltransferase involved in cell wall biosynthesis
MKKRLKGFTSDIYSKMRESSMYLMTSEFEGFPLVLIEAMSTGLPVVSYACPTGPKDIIDDGKNGFLVPVNDEDMFAEKICVLIENEPLRKKMGQEALSVSQRYEIDTIIPCWMTLFQNLKTEKC